LIQEKLLCHSQLTESEKRQRRCNLPQKAKSVLRKRQSARWSADMADASSASASSAIVPVTMLVEGRFAPVHANRHH